MFMMSSHSSCVDLVVLAMGTYESDVCDLAVVVHGYDQLVVVSFDIKNHLIARNKTGMPIS